MKNISLLLLLMICLSTSINAQSILAGSYGSSDNYVDITPDFILTNGGDYHSNNNTYPIDLNGDDIIDISITGLMIGWNYRIGNISVKTEEHSKVAFYRIDTISPYTTIGECEGKTDQYFNLTHNFPLYDTINNSIIWSDSIHNYIIYDYIQGCYNNSSYYYSSGIIGVQLSVDADTLYGWVKISNLFLAPSSGANVTIEEYACTIGSSGIAETNSSMRIFPNPCEDILAVELSNSFSHGVISIYSLNGSLVLKKQIDTPKFTIDLSSLEDGIYVLKMNNGESSSYKKIIKF